MVWGSVITAEGYPKEACLPGLVFALRFVLWPHLLMCFCKHLRQCQITFILVSACSGAEQSCLILFFFKFLAMLMVGHGLVVGVDSCFSLHGNISTDTGCICIHSHGSCRVNPTEFVALIFFFL